MSETSEPARRAQHLVFTVAGGEYALTLLAVREILQYDEVTPLPSAPRSIRGVINLRGRAVAVVDLAVKLGHVAGAATQRTCILVVEIEREGGDDVLGLMVEAVSEVVELGEDDIDEPPALGDGARLDWVVGMGKVGQKFVPILDLAAALAARDGSHAPGTGAPPQHLEAGAGPLPAADAPA